MYATLCNTTHLVSLFSLFRAIASVLNAANIIIRYQQKISVHVTMKTEKSSIFVACIQAEECTQSDESKLISVRRSIYVSNYQIHCIFRERKKERRRLIFLHSHIGARKHTFFAFSAVVVSMRQICRSVQLTQLSVFYMYEVVQFLINEFKRSSTFAFPLILHNSSQLQFALNYLHICLDYHASFKWLCAYCSHN